MMMKYPPSIVFLRKNLIKQFTNGHFENFLVENQHFFQVIYQKMQNDLAIILVLLQGS